MAIHVVKVPDIGEGIAEVELVEWHVAVGDIVASEQVLADVMTDKATVEVPSPEPGRVVALGGKAGEKLAVGSELLRIEVAEAVAAVAPTPLTPTLSRERGRESSDAQAASSTSAARLESTRPLPAQRGEGRGEGHMVNATDQKPLASPSVRRHARELGVELRQVRGTGSDGRIEHEDVVRFAARGEPQPASAGRYAERVGEQSVPVIGLRRQIAQRMQESLRIPHFTYVEEVDVTELEALRARLNAERGAAKGHLTVLPFLMRAIVLAVPSFPQLNARFDDAKGVVTRVAAVHIGVATQAEGGLMVPVVRHAETRDLWASAAEVARLADAARTGRATRDELSGSTITITSLGPLGGLVTTPIINPPEVAIVGVNRIVEKPVVRGGAIVARQTMNLSSSFDHRVVDGRDAAEFVRALRGYLECPAMLFLD